MAHYMVCCSQTPGVQVSVSRERCTGRRWGHTSCLREALLPPLLTWAKAPPGALGWHRGRAWAPSLRTLRAVLRLVRAKFPSQEKLKTKRTCELSGWSSKWIVVLLAEMALTLQLYLHVKDI